MHALTLEQIFKRLNSSPAGLSEAEAKSRLQKYGENRLPEDEKFGKLRIFGRQFKSPLIVVLLLASGVSLFLKDYFDATIIFAAVVLNVAIAYFQEEKADEALKALKKIAVESALVFRDGYLKEKPAAEIVPGDAIFLKAGNKIPADARIVESRNLFINESVLTGEWLPVEKNPAILVPPAGGGIVPLAERTNAVFSGSVVDGGEGKALVFATGRKTEFGKIAESLKEQKAKPTPLQKKLMKFSRALAIVISFVALFIFFIGLAKGIDFIQIFVLSVAVAVAAVPEGLPIGLTLILAVGMKRILEKGGLVKSLLAAETLGGATVICADKTGTITSGEMLVAGILTSTKELLSDGKSAGWRNGEKIDVNGIKSHILALKAVTLCNEGFIENPDDELKDWVIRGRMTDKALIAAGMQAGLNKPELEKQYPLLDIFHFDASLKYQATLHRFDEKHNILYAAGGPEAIIRLSKSVHADGKEEISEKLFKELISKYENLSKKGLRVVSAAYKKIPASRGKIEKDDFKDFVLLGFIALKDPIRPEVKQAVDDCRRAGIRIIIITGDHKFTAKAISEELEISASDDEIITGPELEKMSDEELEAKIGKVKIFARSSPEHKLRVVEALQKRGEITAMTGDGVNDAPALKKADIGVVLGSGTDVAKETGDLILLNNSFAVIVSAIKQGRIIFDNLKKIVIYILADSFTEVLLIGAALFSGMPSPLLPAQILWVNLVEDSLPAFSLAFEKGEHDVLNLPPKGMKSVVWDFEVKTFTTVITLLNAGVLYGIYWILSKNGFSLEHIRTIIFCGIGANALLYVFSCRSLRVPIWKMNPFENKYLVFSSLLGIFLIFAAVYVPFLRWVLKTESLGIFEWIFVFGLGFLNIAAIEAIKLFIARRKR